MMADQTIDSLTVDVGITQEDFQAGVQKILQSLGQIRIETAATGEGMTSSLSGIGGTITGLGLRFAGLFGAVKGIDEVVGYFKNLSVELSHLAISSEYLGQSVPEFSRFGQVAKLAGGQAQDAITAAQNLQSAIFGLEFQGQMSQNLLMLQRLGVGYLTTRGQMRDMKDIAFETAKALQQQLPGKANEAMRVQWATQIFGAGGIANAVGGGLNELRTFYAKAASEQKAITEKAAEEQRKLQQNLTDLGYTIKNDAVKTLNDLTPQIENLVGAINTGLIPTIDEIIGDLMNWLHPQSAVDKAMSGKGVGPLGFSHPINTFEAFGIGLGIAAGNFHDWFEKHMEDFRADKLAGISVPGQVTSRLAPNTNLTALKLLHIEAGGDSGDPTWSKAVSAYGGLSTAPGGVAGYVQSALTTGNTVPFAIPVHALTSPHLPRPAAAATPASKPTASTAGPRVQIGEINIQTQAKDANGIAAGIGRALDRKLLVAQADPGLA